jgi:nickel/cobalt transporter (NicO) family protein
VRRALVLVVALVAVAAAAWPAGAGAHPLGNFSINHLDVVRVSPGSVRVHYVLDQAEIPTFQERGLSRGAILARKRREVARGVRLTVDGRPVPLALASGGALSFPPGAGGLHTTRVELELAARVRGIPRAVELDDATFPGRVGWKAVVVAPGAGTAVRSNVPQGDPTNRLRAYPKALLSSPADTRTARLRVGAGDGTVVAPAAPGAGAATTHDRGAGDRFAGVFADAATGRGVLVLLLLAAFGWGAVHALSPGHGKAMVAAYLVGARGTPRHALALGLTVTATHTAGVFALGFVTLALSQLILPEQLYPWLNLASGVLVMGVGVVVLRGRGRAAWRHVHAHTHAGHHHEPRDRPSARAIAAMGASAGLLPCPSALVVLLGAVAQHQIALGLVLIVAFSAGLATTLSAVGLAVVLAGRAATRVRVPGRLVAALPVGSAAAIVVVGLVLTAQALGKVT